jgi:hypothetical protein
MSNKTTTTKGKETGKGSKGRPTVEGSARQARLAARAARVAAGGEVKRGRPAVAGSARQAKLAAQAARIAAGGEIKRGRPAVKKAEVAA